MKNVWKQLKLDLITGEQAVQHWARTALDRVTRVSHKRVARNE